jgi:hypothetical protein
MKLVVLSIVLLSSPLVATASDFQHIQTTEAAIAQQVPETKVVDEDPEVGTDEDPGEDSFDSLMETDVPNDMIVQPKPVSALEAYLRQCGVQLLMKYIAFKIWLEHYWQSLAASRA